MQTSTGHISLNVRRRGDGRAAPGDMTVSLSHHDWHNRREQRIDLTTEDAEALLMLLRMELEGWEPSEAQQGLVPIPDGYAEQ